MLSAAATPVALFTLGGIVARPQRADSAPLAHRPLNGASLAWPALLKLVLHPALVWAVAWALGGQGTAWTALILAAALPSASNVSMMAEREGVRTPAVARIILLTTALALISLTLWAHALGVQPVGH